jgi:hypothetical protein
MMVVLESGRRLGQLDEEDHSMKPRNIAAIGFPQSGLADVAAEAVSNGSSPDEYAQGDDAEGINYDPIPSKKTVTISVYYRIRGRGKPLPYLLDEGEDR